MSNITFKHAKIKGISFVMPSNICTDIDEKIKFFDNDIRKLNRAKKIVGYGKTFISPNGLTSVDICEYAARDLISKLNIDTNTIDGVLFVTQLPDFKMPGTAQVIHGRLELSNQCIALSINQGCTGYLYGLMTASALIESGSAKNILLLAGDSISKSFCDSGDKNFNMLFSSAGSATFIQYSDDICESVYSINSYGKDYETLIIPGGEMRLPLSSQTIDKIYYDANNNAVKLDGIFMNGLSIFAFTMTRVVTHIQDFFQSLQLSYDDIDLFGIHQANKQILNMLRDKLNVSEDKLNIDTFTKYGNTSCISSIHNILDSNSAENFSQNKYKVALISFGVGLSISSAILNFDHIYTSGIVLHNFKNIVSPEETLNYWIDKIIYNNTN